MSAESKLTQRGMMDGPLLQSEANPPLVLIVDDEESILRLLQRALEEVGYELLAAGDATSATEMVRASSRPVNLAVVDIRLPGMDGPGLVEVLRRSQPTLPVLFISGFGDAEERNRLHDPLLTKPFSPDELVQCVRDGLAGAGRLGEGDG